MSVLDGEWVEPTPERYIKVELTVSESLARDSSDDILALLMGKDAVDRVRELLAADDA